MIIIIYILLGLAAVVFLYILVFTLSWVQAGAWIARFEKHLQETFNKNKENERQEKK